MKILGTIIKIDLSWNDNCQHLIKKVNARMQLLRGVLSFGASNEEMVNLWILFCRSVLEQSCVLWHNSLTQENIEDLERTQKSFTKMVLKDKYINSYHETVRVDMEKGCPAYICPLCSADSRWHICTGFRVKVVEKSGTTLKSILVRSDP